ncbi:MAG: DUF542 domain-containing protein [Bacteroidia bacterium]|nr:DUF542 domain-containing protein [Bacteroidia bacterium]
MDSSTEKILIVSEIEPRFKHSTVFQYFDDLMGGESFIHQNDHDPKPLYYQLKADHGETFTWEYLAEGPEVWKIRIGKHNTKPAATSDEIVLNATLIEPQYKHATIFAQFDNLREGQSFILQNDHDPKPLHYQLLQTRGNVFKWEYLEEGPQWWRIRITKQAPKQGHPALSRAENGEYILNATLIDPQYKHASIFAFFDDHKEGESFILKNDHDPKPLYYQLQQNRGDIFTWDYLQEGPEWWVIRIAKKNFQHQDSAQQHEEGDVLDATQLHPSVKHSKIFEKIDSLKPGESFILKNDHDPVPLYYQLEQTRGKEFSWEYVEKGPQWWHVQIGRNEELKSEGTSAASNDDENKLDVTQLPPARKHPTIFERFDALTGGKWLTIYNDHDPKPLYYQLMAERGNIFTWEYLEQGPQWWIVRITKRKTGEQDETLGQIVTKDFRKAVVFAKYNLDYGFLGKQTVKEACAEKGLDVTLVEQELQQVEKNIGNSVRPLPYNDWNIDFLADYIVNTHHSFIKQLVPDLRTASKNVLSQHVAAHPELEQIHATVDKFTHALLAHLQKEETILFPMLKQLVHSHSTEGAVFDTVAEPINMFEMEHDTYKEYLTTLRELTNDYTLPSDSCASYELMYKLMQDLEADLIVHAHLENNILFPKYIELEGKSK